MLEYFYHQSIRKIVVAFGTLFNKVYIARYDDAGVEIERMKVPIGYGPQQKFLRRLQRIGTDFNQTQVKIENYIPRISFEMQSVVYDPTRKLNTLNQTIRYNNPTSLTTRYERVPYNIDFTLGVVTKNTEDALQIMEQILPYFQPEYTVTIKMNDMDPAVDIPFVIKTCTMGDGEDGSYGNYDMRKLTYMTFTFTAKVYLYGPFKTQPVITATDFNFFDMNGGVTSTTMSVSTAQGITAGGYSPGKTGQTLTIKDSNGG